MAEPNWVLWRGVRPTSPEEVFTYREPPEKGTYASGYATVQSGYATIYTVPALKLFHLTDWSLTCYPHSGAGFAELVVRDAVPATVAVLARLLRLTNEGLTVSKTYAIAYQIPAGYSVQIYTANVNVRAYGHITGYTKNA